MISRSLRRKFKEMLDELEASGLEVAKVPSRDGGYVRVPVSVNAEWYRRFCRRYLSTRRRYPKPRTIIKRCHTIRNLKRLSSGMNGTVYCDRLMRFVEDER